ncbi:MAG: immunoglobulin domain-containing protein [Bacteroidota bacterium]
MSSAKFYWFPNVSAGFETVQLFLSQIFFAEKGSNLCPIKQNIMPNGGSHHCGNCRHFNTGKCILRNEPIKISHWTTCRNWNSSELKPVGVIHAIVSEVKNRAGSYSTIPYFNGIRADTKQEGYNDTTVVWESKDGQQLIFKDVDEYMSFYESERIKKQKYIIGAVIGDVIDGYGTNHYTWEKSTTNCNGVWDSIPTAHSAIYDTPILNSTAYYRLQVTQSGFNCKTTSNCVILQVNPLPDITIHSDTLVCNNVPLTIVSSVTGGAGVNHYQYQFRYTVTDSWSDIGIGDGTLFLNSLAQRTQFRCLLNQSGQGCADTSNSIWVNVHTIPLIINQPQASSVCIGGSTQFSISVTTNDTPTYQWFGPHGLINGATTPNVSINPVTAADSGYYHCEVMNSCFYAISDSVKLSILPTYIHPTAITGIDHRCKGTGWDAFSVDGQFPTTYLWSLAPSVAGTINPATGLVTWNATWDGVAAITYKSSGCGLSDSVTVFVNTILPVENPTTITGEPYRCQGWGTSQYSTIATNDTGFVWSIVSAGLSQIDQNTGLVTWDQMFNGTATISVYARGCYGPSAVISKNVDVLHAPVMFITESLNRCEGENASFMVNHYDTNMIFRYQWFGPNGLIMGANDSIFNISPVSLVDSGTYYCQVSAYCGDAQSPPAELTIHHRPMVSFMATPKCMRDTVYFANASTADDMPLTSLWYFGDGDSSQLFSPAHIYPDSITYTVRLIEENAFGCKDSSSLVIQSFALPFFTLTATNDSCFGQSNGTILVNVTNGLMPFSYAINNISPQDTNWFSALPGGLYTITVLDSNKCAVKDTISVIEPPRIKSQYDKTDVKCYSDSTGAIQLAIIGGVKPYTFVWSNGDTTQNLSQIPIGYYSVLISDAFGCKNSYD